MFDVDASDVRWSLLLLSLLLLSLLALHSESENDVYARGAGRASRGPAGLGRQGGLGTPPIYPQNICEGDVWQTLTLTWSRGFQTRNPKGVATARVGEATARACGQTNKN